MEFSIRNIPWDITRVEFIHQIAKDILHNDEFLPISSSDERRINFHVKLNHNDAGGIGNNGTGILILPTRAIGSKFLAWIRSKAFVVKERPIRFYQADRPPSEKMVSNLTRTHFIDPAGEEKRLNIVRELSDGRISVDSVQFGVFFQPTSRKGPGKPVNCPSTEFSVESAINKQASLYFDYNRKAIQVTIPQNSSNDCFDHMIISFSDISKIYVGYGPPPYVCFDTVIPASFEREDIYRTLTGDRVADRRKYKRKIGALDPGHARISRYCHKIRLQLFYDGRRDVVEHFCALSKFAGLPEDRIIRGEIEASAKHTLLSDKVLHGLRIRFDRFVWPIMFQLECLLHSGILHTGQIDDILLRVEKLYKKHSKDPDLIALLLRTYNAHLPYLDPGQSPMECFEHLASASHDHTGLFALPSGNFNCYHVTFTPTRRFLEGPYPTQSNRVIRLYPDFQDRFMRVDFCEEDSTQYGDKREIESIPFLQSHVGHILREGFRLGNRDFEFLGYSNSSLRNHSVWFMSPFDHPSEGRVTSESIRASIGDFKGLSIEDYPREERMFYDKDQELLRHPSKYAARLGQAFTATRPSVTIRRDQWEIVPDVGNEPYLFTDGIGSISEELRNRIENKLNEDHDRLNIVPSAYQIRILGFKGVVAVDQKLQGEIHMRLRPSMRKFGKITKDDVDIEIVQSFGYPMRAYLNRPLVMFLEDKGVKKEHFKELLNGAKANVYSSEDSLNKCYSLMKAHSLGQSFRLPWVLEQLDNNCCDIVPNHPLGHINVDNPFFQELRNVAQLSILRDIKYDARIPVPDSYVLVGVVDEGPAHRSKSPEPINELQENEIYACIQEPDDIEPRYIEGLCAVCRNPITHPGDVQRVNAIGKPPPNKRFMFAHMKNVVVFPSKGKRSIPSCLAGGDLDGDIFMVIKYPQLLPVNHDAAASYRAPQPRLLSRACNIEDVCEFVVRFIHSNILGLLSFGVRDESCLKLADLCSQAVDYSKHGVEVDLKKNPLPEPLLPHMKPDWQANDPHPPETDYYKSNRALGDIWHGIELLPSIRNGSGRGTSTSPNPLSSILRTKVERYIDPDTCIQGHSEVILRVFRRYRDELQYICNTHVLTAAAGNTPKSLRESEVVMGVMLARSPDKTRKNDRIWRMKTHTRMLIRDVKVALKLIATEDVEPREILELAWCAWETSAQRESEFAANSFGLIALDCLFQALEKLTLIELI
ncbi:hypothetical protein VNI00_009150 [Paramarasmius palmivorus]|uniref:RNA-dependent RNA polymerase n=1 Tax=Paramarasmius palmivorus TaxID=297713 RepID=A0AAW0CS92_9AGAR